MRIRMLVLGAAAAIVAGACASKSNTAAPAAGLSDADRAALQTFLDSVGSNIRARNWDGFVGSFAEDAVFMPPNHPVLRGKSALRAWADSNPQFSDFGFSNATFDGSGDLAWGTSSIHLAFTPPGSKLVADTSKQLFVIRKQADGSWKTVAVAFNSDLPLPMPGGPPPPAATKKK